MTQVIWFFFQCDNFTINTDSHEIFFISTVGLRTRDQTVSEYNTRFSIKIPLEISVTNRSNSSTFYISLWYNSATITTVSSICQPLRVKTGYSNSSIRVVKAFNSVNCLQS